VVALEPAGVLAEVARVVVGWGEQALVLDRVATVFAQPVGQGCLIRGELPAII